MLRLFAALLGFALLAAASCTSSSECDEADCVCMGTCICLPGDELTEDYLDVRPLYTVGGLPVVVLRLDLTGTCFGEGARTYIVYRTAGLEIATEGVDVDGFRTPRNVPDSFAHEYDGLTIEVRSIAATGLMLTFIDPTGTNETLTAQCDGSSGTLSCAEL
jgi:hypothetical protein